MTPENTFGLGCVERVEFWAPAEAREMHPSGWSPASPVVQAGRDAPLDFALPPDLEAGAPAEALGLARDQVKLMVSERVEGQVAHTQFRTLPCILDPGDLLVINTSGTLNASLAAVDAEGNQFELHLSTHLPGGLWMVELRRSGASGSEPYHGVTPGESFTLPAGGSALVHAPYVDGRRGEPRTQRLWLASLDLPFPVADYLACYGAPIRYRYVKKEWPSQYYQTVYVTEYGSAEMPSAGRAFTPELITRLVARGVQIAPLLLHTGVASPEAGEPPYEEYYRVPLETAQAANAARERGRRVIAVGTTVVRALETVTDRDGNTHPGEGWTRLVITRDTHLRAVNSLLTGLHEPRSTHLAILAALAGYDTLRTAYEEALRMRYLWHEFGDMHLIL